MLNVEYCEWCYDMYAIIQRIDGFKYPFCRFRTVVCTGGMPLTDGACGSVLFKWVRQVQPANPASVGRQHSCLLAARIQVEHTAVPVGIRVVPVYDEPRCAIRLSPHREQRTGGRDRRQLCREREKSGNVYTHCQFRSLHCLCLSSGFHR